MAQVPPDPEWQPISQAELENLIASEVQDFDAEKLALWDRLRVPLEKVSVVRSEAWGEEYVFVVARRGHEVLYFDDVEDEFAVGTVTAGKLAEEGGLAGELRHAVSIFDRRDG